VAQIGRDTARVAKANVDLVRKQIGDVDLARVLRDDDAWAARLADIDSFFMDDFEFVVRVPGEPVTGKGFEEFRARFVDWIEPWDTYLPKIEQILDLGDRRRARPRPREGQGHGSGD